MHADVESDFVIFIRMNKYSSVALHFIGVHSFRRSYAPFLRHFVDTIEQAFA